MGRISHIMVLAGILAALPISALAAPSPSYRDTTRASANLRSAQVFKANLSPISPKEGIWRGRVQGMGNIALALEILRSGRVVERRSMGKVRLNGESTWFAYRSWLPSGSNWSWKVIAWTERESIRRP